MAGREEDDRRRAGAPGPRRLLVVTADDYGLTTATSLAILDAHARGMVTAVSVLPNAPATTSTLPLLSDHPSLEVGVHLALVGEDAPICPPASIPSLVDRRGRLAASWRQLVARLASGRIDLDDVRREVDAQLEVVAAGAGRPLTHLNLHQHLQLWPSIGRIAASVALEHGIGYVRTPWATGPGPRSASVRFLARPLRRRLRAAGLATSDGFLGLSQAGRFDGSRLRRDLSAVEGRTVEVNVHPGAIVDAERARYRWGYRWADEFQGVTDPSTAAAAARAGFRLVGPSTLGDGGQP